MRIAYIGVVDAGSETGVIKKICTQLQVWRELGHEVRFFALSPQERVWHGLQNEPVEVVSSGSFLTRLFRVRLLLEQVTTWRPHIVYLRSGLYHPGYVSLMRAVPAVVEVNTDDTVEYRSTLPRWKYVYHLATRQAFLRSARGFVFVTEELARRFSGFGKPFAVVSNGIDLAKYPHIESLCSPVPRLVFIGHPGYAWHGVDKILELATYLPRCIFDIIGYREQDIACTVPENVVLHGQLSREQYEHRMLTADCAFGSLALHRNGLNEACPLKVREYLAYGIPTVIAYRDPDFCQPVRYLLRLPNTETNIRDSIGDIKSFIENMRGKRVARSEVKHIDSREKELARLRFLESLLG